MSDYLMREDAPLTDSEWQRIDETVVNVARQNLIGRRVLSIYGPLGAGLEMVQNDIYEAPQIGSISVDGEVEDNVVKTTGRAYTPLLIVSKDFHLPWRQLEMSRQLDLPLDTAAAAAAAAFCARAEDKLIFHGNADEGAEGLLNAKGRTTCPLTDWTQPGAGFDNLVNAVAKLSSVGFNPPYAAILSPNLYNSLLRVYKDSDTLELTHAKEALSGGVYQTSVLEANQGLVLAMGPQNFDLAIGQDLVTAYLEGVNLNHVLRVFETVALRIKRPGAICVLGKSSK